jgi:hypothetical protein
MSDVLVRNAGDEQQLDDATRKLSAREAQERKDLIAILSTLPGRRECWRLLKQCGVYTTSFVGEQPMQMAFNEGGRNIGLWMTDRLTRLVPQLYIQMRDEAARENW